MIRIRYIPNAGRLIIICDSHGLEHSIGELYFLYTRGGQVVLNLILLISRPEQAIILARMFIGHGTR